jgi:GTP cyclohydrolase IA
MIRAAAEVCALLHQGSHPSPGTLVVQVRDIEFASTSVANLLPFHGRCHIAYMPSRGVVLGLSKFARLTGLFAR